MRLLFHPLSSYSRKVEIGIGLRGDPVERVTLNVFAGDLSSDWFRALSPFGKMPVLDGTPDGAVYESTTILEYLEARGPRVLMPEGQEARCRHFDRLGDLYLLTPVGNYFWRKDDATRDASTETMARAWSVWERELADGRAFICGDRITLADLSAAVAAHYAVTEGLALPPAIAGYRERLEAHPVLAASRDAALPFVEATKPRRLPPTA